MTPYGHIDLGQLRHQAITWTNVVFSLVTLCELHQSNFTASVQATILYNDFDNYMFKIATTFPQANA